MSQNVTFCVTQKWETVTKFIPKLKKSNLLTLSEGGAFKAPSNENCNCSTFLMSNWAQKIWLFLKTYEDATYSLFGGWNGKKGVSVALLL